MTSVAPPVGTSAPQGVTRFPVVISFPAGSTIPEYIIPPGVQVYTFWLANNGGVGLSLAVGLGSSQPFIPFDRGTWMDFGCQAMNEGVRLDFAGVQTETIVIVYWTFPGDVQRIGGAG